MSIIKIETTQDLCNIVLALNEAVLGGIMARDYAKLVWKEVLKRADLEVAKPVFEKKVEGIKV